MTRMDGPTQIIHGKPIKSAEQYLYHYTTADTAIRHILATGTLRMSPFTAVNDPREAKHWLIEKLLNPGNDATEELAFMERTASLALKGDCKLLCFTQDAPEAANAPALPIDFDFATVWHRGFCRQRMWAQYASTVGVSDGVCLVFDAARLEAALTAALPPSAFFRPGNVRYENRIPFSTSELTFDYERIKSNGMDAAIKEHLDVHWRALFFTKAADWRDEREFRYLVSNVPDNYFVFSFKDALKSIVAGPDFPEHQVGHLIDTCVRSFGIRPSQLHWKNGYPKPYPEIEF